MQRKELITENRYFAAANGYKGFRSYFDEIFNPVNYQKIYVLKGGPGTGKSSLMKAVSRHFSDIGIYNEAIFCSSDPSSLDGVIIEKNGNRVAIIDGTAPHERDAIIPGAIDEIVNLGENWDSKMLERRRNEIMSINQKKKNAYKNAYSFLSLISDIDSKIKAEYKENINISEIIDSAKEFANEKLSPLGCSGKRTRLTSSFSKDGYTHLNTLSKISKTVYTVRGDGMSEFIFMRALYDASSHLGAAMLRAPSPFSDDDIEELYYPEDKITLSIHAQNGEIIDTANASTSHFMPPSYEYLKSIKNELLKYAKGAFSEASNAHFELEKIYVRAMNFRKNQELTECIIEKIEKKLSI